MKEAINMQKIYMKNIKFVAFIKLFMLMSLSVGFFIAIMMFCLTGILGIGHATIDDIKFYGFAAGIIHLFTIPAISIVFGLFSGIFAYLPFRIIMKVLRRVKLKGEFGTEGKFIF